MTLIRLLMLPSEPYARPELLEANGAAVSRRVLEPGESLAEDGPVALIVPGAEAVARWMDLPVGSPAQARSAAAFRVEDEVALGGADLHIAVGAADSLGRTLVVWAARERLQAWLDVALSHGVTPQAVIPDYLLLPEGEEGQPVVAPFGQHVAVREPGRAFNADPELAALLIGERPHLYISADDLDPWLLAGARAPLINLLQGRFATRDGAARRDLKRPALLAAAVLISPLVLLAAQIIHDNMSASRMEKQAAILAVSLVPQASRYEDAGGYALSRLRTTQGGRGFGELSASYLTVIQSAPGVTLDTLVYGDEGAIRSAISYANYSDVDQLRNAAKRVGLELTEQSTVSEAGRISSDLLVRSKP